MNKDQTLSMIRSVAKMVGVILVMHGYGTDAMWATVADDVIGAGMIIYGIVASHMVHGA